MKKLMNVKQIAEKYEVSYTALLRFMDYCRKSGTYELPTPTPSYEPGYHFTESDGKKLVELFKNKKRGEMSEYHYEKLWGKKFREKYPRKNK